MAPCSGTGRPAPQRTHHSSTLKQHFAAAPCSSTTTLAPKRTYPTHPLLEVRAPIAALFGEQGHLLQIAIEYIYIYVCLSVLIYWKVNQLGSWCLKRKCVLLFVGWKVSTQGFLRTTFPVVFTKAPTTQLF